MNMARRVDPTHIWKIAVWLPMLPLACQAPASDHGDDLVDISHHRVSAEVLTARRELASSGRFTYTPPPSATAATAEAMAAALDIPAFMISNASYTGPGIGAEVLANLGSKILPRRGNDAVVLSTGSIVTPPYPEPGTDIAPSGPAGDIATLRIELNVPEGADRLSFEYNFLSSEYPDFVGSEFNDVFEVRVTDANGPHEPMVLASVNEAIFHAASDTQAAGSGYDIYSPDPGEIDFEFDLGIGVPDAGLTGFHSRTVAIAGGGAVILEFEVRDEGDGIIDSSVVIDNVDIQFIEVLDPVNTPLMNSDGRVTTDPGKLSTVSGRYVTAAAADGATQVLLRTRVPDFGNVEFSLVGGTAPGDGGFSAIGAEGRATSINVPVIRTAADTFYAFALYTAPESFDYAAGGVFNDLGRRPLAFQARFTSGAGERVLNRDFELVRPPVVIIPGVWSGCDDWLNQAITKKAHFLSKCEELTADPVKKFAAAEELALNVDTVVKGVQSALGDMRSDKIAATQADVIGHTTGGLLARMRAGQATYLRADNFMKGDFNRLITVNTPHLGSAMAARVLAYHNSLGDAPLVFNPQYIDDDLCQPAVCSAGVLAEPNPGCIIIDLECARTAIHRGIIQDLQPQPLSPALNAIDATNVPSHALYGIGGSNVPDSIPPPTNTTRIRTALLQRALLWLEIENSQPPADHVIFAANSVTFGAAEHDLFTTQISQKGGIVESATSPFVGDTSGSSSLFRSIKVPPYHERIEALLESPIDARVGDAPLFGTFPAPRDVAVGPTAQAMTDESSIRPQAIVPDGIALTAPANGTQVRPGEVVTVRIEPRNGFSLQHALLLGPDGPQALNPGELELAYSIPADAVGEVMLYATAYDALLNRTYSSAIFLPVVIEAELQSLEILGDDPVLFGIGAATGLTVLGHFDDGITRNISSPGTGTVYQTSEPEIVSVSPTGIVTATGPGIATVVARNGLVQTSISVTVVNPNRAPIAGAGADQSLACEQPGGTAVNVALDGSSSYDVNGDAITYTWSENGVTIATGATPTVSLGPGTHVLTLVVNDGEFDSEPDTVQIIVDECPPSTCPLPEPPLEAVCRADCPCTDGVGDCDRDLDCAPGLRCVKDVGSSYGYTDPEVDVCVLGCPDIGVGAPSFCTPECPCDHGQGDCDDDSDCAAGLRCMRDSGPSFGFDDPETDVCVFGCPDTGVGTPAFCTPECPCDHGEGDCDDDEDCAPGLDCQHNVGASYGYDDPGLDVCVGLSVGAASMNTATVAP